MKELKKYKYQTQFTVQWGDMDAARHVNNLMYLKWTESARVTYMGAVGIDISFASETGPILGWQDCKYIFPITYPDTVIIGVRTAEIRKDRLMLETSMFSKRHQRIAAISKQSIIPYNYRSLEKIPIPQDWLQQIKEFEGSEIIYS